MINQPQAVSLIYFSLEEKRIAVSDGVTDTAIYHTIGQRTKYRQAAKLRRTGRAECSFSTVRTGRMISFGTGHLQCA